MKATVKKVFRDKFTKVMYEVGNSIEIEDEDRMNDLVKRGLVEAEKPKRKRKK